MVLTEEDLTCIKNLKEKEVGLPVFYIYEDNDNGVIDFYFKPKGSIPVTSRVTIEEAERRISEYKNSVDTVKRICRKMLFETGTVPDAKLVSRVVKQLELTPQKIAENNTYETLKRVEDVLARLGPGYNRFSLQLDEDGKIVGLHDRDRYVKPRERVTKI